MKTPATLGLLTTGLLLALRPALPPTETLKAEALQDLQAHYAEYQSGQLRVQAAARRPQARAQLPRLKHSLLRKVWGIYPAERS